MTTGKRETPRASDLRSLDAETDVVVIGSGIGGLTCAALLAKNGCYCCGDSNMPGVGVPAVAVSGMMTAGAVGA